MVNMEKKDVWEKIKQYLEEIDYGKIIVTIHEGKISYIEKQEKEKIGK